MIKKYSLSDCLIKSASILTALSVLSAQVQAVPVEALVFTDRAWQSCITGIAKQQNWADTEDFIHIKCHSADISAAEHLEKFTHLVSLSLYNNALTELDVRELTQLSSLNVAGNQLEILQVSGLPNLTRLYGFKNQLKNVDLNGLVSLKQLRLMDNQLTALDTTALVSLEDGHLFNNQLTTLDIKRLNKLKFLDVRQNPMPDELYDEFDETEGVTISHDGNADDWK